MRSLFVIRKTKIVTIFLVCFELVLVVFSPLFNLTSYPLEAFTGLLVVITSVCLSLVLLSLFLYDFSLDWKRVLFALCVLMPFLAAIVGAWMSGNFQLSFFGLEMGLSSGAAVFVFISHLLWARWIGLVELLRFKFVFLWVVLLAIGGINILEVFEIKNFFDGAVFYMAGVALLSVVYRLDVRNDNFKRDFLLYIVILSFLILLFPVISIWIASLIFFGTLAVLFVSQKYSVQPLPFYGCIIFLIFFLFFLYSFGTQKSLNIDPSFAEPVLALQTSYRFLKRSSAPELFFGRGSSHYTEFWYEHRSAALNTLPSWYYEYGLGGGFVLSHMFMNGLIGVFAWLFFLSCYIKSWWKHFWKHPQDIKNIHERQLLLLAVFGAAVLLCVGAIGYFGLLAIAVLMGAAVSQTAVSPSATAGSGTSSVLMWSRKTFPFVGIFGVVISIWSLVPFAQSSFFYEQGLVLFSGNASYETVMEKFDRAIAYRKHPDILRAASRVSLSHAQMVLTAPIQDDVNLSAPVLLTRALQYGDEASSVDPLDFRNWITLGDVYVALIPAAGDAQDLAYVSYQKAEDLTSTNLGIRLRFAQAQVVAGKYQTAMESVIDTIFLGCDFKPAWILMKNLQEVHKVEPLPAYCNNWSWY